jgi:hypothetical protein
VIGTVLAALAALAFIALGLGAIFAPERSASGYGLASSDPSVGSYVRAVGGRDLVLGAIFAVLLVVDARPALAVVSGASALVGAADFMIVWRARGTAARANLAVHAIGTAGLIVLCILLARGI